MTEGERAMPLVSDCRIERRQQVERQVAAMVAGAFAIFIASGPAIAQPISDPATGLAVNPAPGYVAKPAPASGNYTVSFDVKKPDDKDTGCRVGFQPAPQNAGMTQDEINAFTAKPDWADLVRTTLSRLYVVISLDRFEHAGVRGAVVVGDFRLPPGAPPRAAEIRSWLVMLETPKGRTSIVCVGEKPSFEARRSEFVDVARGVTLPK
jgi:hypothetical protein